MKNNEKDTAIDIVTVFPRNQFYYKYQLNEGVFHTIKKENALEYFSQFISRKNYSILEDLLVRFLPFTIIVENDKIIELKKKVSDNSYFSKKIKNDVKKQMKVKIDRSPKERIPNDKLLKKINKKMR